MGSLFFPRISFFSPASRDTPQLSPHITRLLVPTRNGPLELLHAAPSSPSNKPPLFFAHGGCGSASVWLPYLTFFSQTHGIPCYAVSYRGHGASWDSGYLRMYFTSKHALAEDLAAGVKYVQEREGQEVVLVGHSSGGGLSQLCLSQGMVRCKGLVLMGAIPGSGSFWVNFAWNRMDPFFNIRMLFHLGHPMSPLSTTALVKQAFFCPEYPLAKVREFQACMPHYESLAWPIGMTFRFVDPRKVLSGIEGWKGGTQRLFVMAAELDRLTTEPICRNLAGWYRGVRRSMLGEKESEGAAEGDDVGVRYDIVPGAGHHMQNELNWKDGGRKILRFYQQL